ncbi:MAG: hypothetical protein IPH29_10270 [Candidatus Microthrix sp.]|nr:hypothetical protein [Candidatus Microthrix sp.]
MASDGPGVRSAVLRAVTDRFLLGQWVEASLAYEPFWDSKPRWIASVGRRQVTDELVVWSERSLFTVNSGGSALAIHFDGTLTLADLGRRRGGGRRRACGDGPAFGGGGEPPG